MTNGTETATTTSSGQGARRIDPARARAARAAGTAVDLPVGAAFAVAERAGGLVESGRSSVRTELTRFGDQLRTELDQAEHRGGTIRRDAIERAQETRTGLERNFGDRREGLELTMRESWTKATQAMRGAQGAARRGRGAAEERARQAAGRVTSLV